MFKNRYPLSVNQLIVLVVAFILMTGNVRFYRELLTAFPLHGLNIAFAVSLTALLGAVTVLMLSLASNRFLLKPALAIALLISAVCAYFSDHFGTVIDTSMLINAAETDGAEAGDLLTAGLLLRVVVFGVLPACLLWIWPVQRKAWKHELLARLKLAGLALLMIVAGVLPLTAHYSSFIREHKLVRYYANPVFPMYSGIRFLAAKANHGKPKPLIQIGLDAKITKAPGPRKIMILVVGETARADHFSVYGYGRQTTPELAKIRDLVIYREVTSCGTSTAISVPCMFSLAGRKGFDGKTVRNTENILDVLERAGVSVFWLDNNSSSKNVADRVTYIDFKTAQANPHCDVECRDTGMLPAARKLIDQAPGDVLIVLHQMGSHGPAYYKRYPKAFERFKPACQSATLSDCDKQGIINAYDNTILYTDYFLAETIKLLKEYDRKHQTMMLYVSDHGESLGEKGIYLHGAPFMMAPEAQINVPLFIWQGPLHAVDRQSLLERAALPQSHDALFPSLMNFYQVESTLTQPDFGLFKVNRTR